MINLEFSTRSPNHLGPTYASENNQHERCCALFIPSFQFLSRKTYKKGIGIKGHCTILIEKQPCNYGGQRTVFYFPYATGPYAHTLLCLKYCIFLQTKPDPKLYHSMPQTKQTLQLHGH